MNQDTNNALALARELDTKAQTLGCPLDRFSDALRQQHARIAELEAQLYAVGAGGVGWPMPEPQLPAAAQHAPVAWAIFSKDGTAMVMWSRDMPCAKNTAEKLGLPLVALYTAPQPTRQPLTDEQIIAIADNARAAESGDAGYILPIAFARAIEAAHGITGGQQ